VFESKEYGRVEECSRVEEERTEKDNARRKEKSKLQEEGLRQKETQEGASSEGEVGVRSTYFLALENCGKARNNSIEGRGE